MKHGIKANTEIWEKSHEEQIKVMMDVMWALELVFISIIIISLFSQLFAILLSVFGAIFTIVIQKGRKRWEKQQKENN